jgi:hypothetical protein
MRSGFSRVFARSASETDAGHSDRVITIHISAENATNMPLDSEVVALVHQILRQAQVGPNGAHGLITAGAHTVTVHSLTHRSHHYHFRLCRYCCCSCPLL